MLAFQSPLYSEIHFSLGMPGHGIVSFSFYIEKVLKDLGEGGDIIVVLKTILLFYEVKNETSISDWGINFRRLPGNKN